MAISIKSLNFGPGSKFCKILFYAELLLRVAEVSIYSSLR